MTIKRVLCILFLTTSSVVVCGPVAAQTTGSQASDDEVRLRVLLREGADLLKAGKYDEARKYLLDAWKIRPNPDVGAVLGQAEILVGLYRAVCARAVCPSANSCCGASYFRKSTRGRSAR